MAVTSSFVRWPRGALIAVVRGYRLLLKPWIGNVCRFEPSCSAYALQALTDHGAARGSALAATRLLRCHPWCDGGLDPVPSDGRLRLFTRFGDHPDGATASSSHPAPELPAGLRKLP